MLVAQRLASFLKLLRSIALSVLLLILLTWNFGTLNTSAREVLAMVPRIQQFEASGVKLVLKDEVKLRAALVAALDGALLEGGDEGLTRSHRDGRELAGLHIAVDGEVLRQEVGRGADARHTELLALEVLR